MAPRSGQLVWGRPVSDPHAGKYGELTPLRQRGGGGWHPQPLLYPLFASVTDDPAQVVKEQWQGWECNHRVVVDVDVAVYAPLLVGAFETAPIAQ